jgi:hypothetical protein
MGQFDREPGGLLVLTVNIDRNRSKPRTGIIQVNRVDGPLIACHFISQDGCGYTVAPALSPDLAAEGDRSSFTVTTSPDDECDYTVAVGAGFIHLDDMPGKYSGTKQFFYNVDPNNSTMRQEGFITATEATFGPIEPPHKVSQKGKTETPGVCSYTFSEFPSSFGPTGGSGGFQILTTNTCRWTARSDVPWTKLVDGSGNVRDEITGMGTVNVGYLVQPTSTFRSGSITILDDQQQSISIFNFIQFGEGSTSGDPCPSYKVIPQSAKFLAGGGEERFEIQVGAGCRWTAKSSESWIRVKDSEGNAVSQLTGDGNRVISYVVDRNVDPISGTSDRPGKIAILNGTGTEVNAHLVTQDGALPEERICTFTLSRDETFVGEGGGTFAFTVNVSGAGCQPVPNSTVPWITNVRTRKGEVIFDVIQWTNADKRQRSGEIKIGNASHTVTQTAGGGSGSANDECPSGAVTLNKTFYGTLSRVTGRADCNSQSDSGFIVDKYRLILTEKTRLAINVAAIDFDPKVSLFADNKKIDDDGGGFRNARVPRLPRKDEFITLDPGQNAQAEYIIEVTSFDSSKVGNYALYIATANSGTPVILGAAVEGKTLLVIGENFDKRAKLFIGESTAPEKNTKNAQSRTRTALVALQSGNKVKEGEPIILRVVNNSGKESEVFIYLKQSSP